MSEKLFETPACWGTNTRRFTPSCPAITAQDPAAFEPGADGPGRVTHGCHIFACRRSLSKVERPSAPAFRSNSGEQSHGYYLDSGRQRSLARLYANTSDPKKGPQADQGTGPPESRMKNAELSSDKAGLVPGFIRQRARLPRTATPPSSTAARSFAHALAKELYLGRSRNNSAGPSWLPRRPSCGHARRHLDGPTAHMVSDRLEKDYQNPKTWSLGTCAATPRAATPRGFLTARPGRPTHHEQLAAGRRFPPSHRREPPGAGSRACVAPGRALRTTGMVRMRQASRPSAFRPGLKPGSLQAEASTSDAPAR